VVKTGTFQEEALRLKGVFGKFYGILCILIFPGVYLTHGTLTLFICLTWLAIGCLWMSFEWTFNHKRTIRYYGAAVALLMLISLLMFVLVPQQQQIFYLYMSAIGFTSTPWLTALTVLALVTFLLLLYYVTAWIVFGPTAYLVTGAWYSRSILFRLFSR
jgi:hypothetical protein